MEIVKKRCTWQGFCNKDIKNLILSTGSFRNNQKFIFDTVKQGKLPGGQETGQVVTVPTKKCMVTGLSLVIFYFVTFVSTNLLATKVYLQMG